eukprot:UN01791
MSLDTSLIIEFVRDWMLENKDKFQEDPSSQTLVLAGLLKEKFKLSDDEVNEVLAAIFMAAGGEGEEGELDSGFSFWPGFEGEEGDFPFFGFGEGEEGDFGFNFNAE